VTKSLQAIGFWRIGQPGDAAKRWRADPKIIVAIRGAQPPDPALLAYLRGGHPLSSYRMYSSCRFKCGVRDSVLGDTDLIDGIWVWPEGLVHYVEAHGVALPEEFVDCARAHHGIVPPLSPEWQ